MIFTIGIIERIFKFIGQEWDSHSKGSEGTKYKNKSFGFFKLVRTGKAKCIPIQAMINAFLDGCHNYICIGDSHHVGM